MAVCTGDLTSAGQPGEFAQVLKILEPLKNSDIPLIYTPGNHDCYVDQPKCVAAMQQAGAELSQGKYFFDDIIISHFFRFVHRFFEIRNFALKTDKLNAFFIFFCHRMLKT